MTKRLIYLVGQPGSGKSLLMKHLTAPFDRISIGTDEAPVAHDQLTREVEGGVADGTIEIIGAELGIRREKFSGTDALPSSVIEKAVPWIKTAPYPLILAEGARLANKRFLLAAIEGGYTPTVVLLEHDQAEEWRLARSAELGKEQDAAWVKGRISASRNLATWAEENAIEVLRGHPDALIAQLEALISPHG